MGNFNQNYRSGGGRGGSRYGGRDSGGRSFGGSRDLGRPAMHRATCAQCGNDCEVPFQPSGDRPVYCSNCFESRRNGDGNSRGSDRRNFARPNFEERRTQSSDRNDNRKTSGPDNSQIIEQIQNLHAKLDKIISVLEPKAILPIVTHPIVTIPKVEKKETVKSKAVKKEVKKVVIKPEDIQDS